MAVDTENSHSGPFLGNGTTTAFPFTFTALATTDVAVVTRDSEGAETTVSTSDYTVSITAGGGGTVTFSSAPATGLSIYIVLEPAFTQDTEFTEGGDFLASVHNVALDRAVLRSQYLKGQTDRAPKVARGATPPSIGTMKASESVVTDSGGNLTTVPSDLATTELVQELAEQVEAAAASIPVDHQFTLLETGGLLPGLYPFLLGPPVGADLNYLRVETDDATEFDILVNDVVVFNATVDGVSSPTFALSYAARDRVDIVILSSAATYAFFKLDGVVA